MISLMLNDVYLQSFWRVGRRRLSGKLEIRPVTQAHKHVECETCVLFCSAVQLPCSRLVRSLLSLRFRVSAAAAATAVAAVTVATAVDGVVIPRAPQEATAHGGLRAGGQGAHGAHFQGQVV